MRLTYLLPSYVPLLSYVASSIHISSETLLSAYGGYKNNQDLIVNGSVISKIVQSTHCFINNGSVTSLLLNENDYIRPVSTISLTALLEAARMLYPIKELYQDNNREFSVIAKPKMIWGKEEKIIIHRNQDWMANKLKSILSVEVREFLYSLSIDPLDLSLDTVNWLRGFAWQEKFAEDKSFTNRFKKLLGLKTDGLQYLGWHLQQSKGLSDVRKQAMKSYPLLPLFFPCNLDALHDEGKYHVLIQAVDQVKSLTDAWSAADVPAWLIKKLNGLKPCDIFRETISIGSMDKNNAVPFDRKHFPNLTYRLTQHSISLWSVLDDLKLIKPEHFPDNLEQWYAFLTIRRLIKEKLTNQIALGDTNQQIYNYLICSVGKNWQSIDLEAFGKGGFRDVETDLTRNLLNPVKAGVGVNINIDIDQLVKLLLWHNKGLKKVIETSEWWHSRFQGITQRLQHSFPREDIANQNWPKLCQDWKASNGYTIQALDQAYLLELESAALNHCVRTYDYRCIFSDTHILGIRDPDNNPISTARISLERLIRERSNNKFPGLDEHRGMNNRAPSEFCVSALTEWYVAVRNGSLEINDKELAENLEFRKNKYQTTTLRSLYDRSLPVYNTSTEQALEAAWQEYSPLFSSQFKSMGLKGLKEMIISLNV